VEKPPKVQHKPSAAEGSTAKTGGRAGHQGGMGGGRGAGKAGGNGGGKGGPTPEFRQPFKVVSRA